MQSGQQVWLYHYPKQLLHVATALFCSGILYLLAANWFYLPAIIQLLLPQLILLAFCLCAHLKFFNKYAIAGANIMIGLALASYGQVYQTGADSYQLFIVWSLLLLPWLYYRSTFTFSLLFFTSLIALFLAQSQLLFWSDIFFMLSLALFILFFLLMAQLFYKKSRPLLLIPVIILSLFFGFNIAFHNNQYFYPWLFALIIPLLLACYYYFNYWVIGVVINVILVACTICFTILQHTLAILNDGLDTLILFAIFILVYFWAVTRLLQLLIKENVYLTTIPIAFGGWLSSLLLTSGLFILLGFIDNELNSLIVISLIIMLGATLIIKTYSTHSLLLRQILYAALLCGQTAFLISFLLKLYNYTSLFELDNSDNYPLIIVFISQLIIFIIVGKMINNSIWRSLQALLLLLLFFLAFPFNQQLLLTGLFLIGITAFGWMEKYNWYNTWLVSICMIITISIIIDLTKFDTLFISDYIRIVWLHNYPIRIIALLMLIYSLYKNYHKIPFKPLISLSLSGTILIIFDQFYILALLSVLLVLSHKPNKLLQWIVMTTLATALIMEYYDLTLSLISKGTIIILSGILLALLALTFPHPVEEVSV